MFNIIIFSKDRACQLDLFLRSIKKFWKDVPCLNVLYKYSNNFFKEAYIKLIEKHSEFNYIEEQDFRNDVLSLVREDNKLTCFFVDDNVFIDYFGFNSREFQIFSQSDHISCLSLRLGKNINYCYSLDIGSPPPETNLFKWRDKIGDWGYPMSVDGHIFMTKDVKPIIESIQFTNPNTFEGNLASNPINKEYMICFEKSRIFNIPANKVQDTFPNRSGSILSTELLNQEFLNGKILYFDSLIPKSVHQEVSLKFLEAK